MHYFISLLACGEDRLSVNCGKKSPPQTKMIGAKVATLIVHFISKFL